MPFQPHICCRAARRQLRPPQDSIWISEDALRHAFLRFAAVSRSGKRYGSSVPGTLESRRRLGKRRMAYSAGSTPTPGFSLGSLWGSFGQADGTQWRWEAPTPRGSTKGDAAPALPNWVHSQLREWVTPSPPLPEATIQTGTTRKVEILEESSHQDTSKPVLTTREEIDFFSKTLSEARTGEYLQFCQDYFKRLKQTLELGLVSREDLNYCCFEVTKAFQAASPNREIANSLFLSFYTNVWEGIFTHGAQNHTTFNGYVMNGILARVLELPFTEEVKSLASRIVRGQSEMELGSGQLNRQLKYMKPALNMLIDAWLKSWHPSRTDIYDLYLWETDQCLQNHEKSVAHVRSPDFDMARANVKVRDVKIKPDFDAAAKAEDRIWSIHSELSALAKILEPLPEYLITSCSKFFTENSHDETVSHCWLFVLSKLPRTNPTTFIAAWKKADVEGLLPEDLMGTLVLKHWTSQGFIRCPLPVMIAYKASKSPSFGDLLFAVKKYHRARFHQAAESLFEILGGIGQHGLIVSAIKKLDKCGFYPTLEIIMSAVRVLSKFSPRWAVWIFCKYRPDLHGDHYHIPIDVAKLAISMIDDDKIRTREIWTALWIPYYSKMPPQQRYQFSRRTLDPDMVRLLTLMAEAFACSPARTPTCIFVNIQQCLHHLRRHNAPITPPLVRALVKAGIARKITCGLWVNAQRLEWIIGLVDQTEGFKVSKEVEDITKAWNLRLQQEQFIWDRSRNVLRGGPID